MPKVTLHRGITIAPKDTYSSFRADVTISDIDTDGDVEEQIKIALSTLDKMSEAIEEPLAQEAADVSGLSIEGVGLAKEFAAFRVKDKEWKAKVAEKFTELLGAKEEPKKEGKK